MKGGVSWLRCRLRDGLGVSSAEEGEMCAHWFLEKGNKSRGRGFILRDEFVNDKLFPGTGRRWFCDQLQGINA